MHMCMRGFVGGLYVFNFKGCGLVHYPSLLWVKTTKFNVLIRIYSVSCRCNALPCSPLNYSRLVLGSGQEGVVVL